MKLQHTIAIDVTLIPADECEKFILNIKSVLEELD